jgi:sialidase-1
MHWQTRIHCFTVIWPLSLAILMTAAGVNSPLCGQQPAPLIEVLDTRTISYQPHIYSGWPTIVRRQNGELWLASSGGREGHVCPFGQLVVQTSRDQGASWTWPRVIADSAIDDRDAGILETAAGTLIATTFTSLAYEPLLAKAEQAGSWPAERLAAWQAVNNRLTPDERKAELGEWSYRSTDGGKSWSNRIPTLVNSPHGPIQLRDGRLLYAGKQLWTPEGRIGVADSTDDGVSWNWLADIPLRPGDELKKDYHELHAVEADNGTLIAQIRMEGKTNENETLQTESTDGGRTWTVPHAIGVWGLPSHLLKLQNGSLLMTYGYRRPPFGNQARLSSDYGMTWSEPATISGDGAGGDLGYPSTVELPDHSLLTVWYELPKGESRSVLRQAHWRFSTAETQDR